MSLQNTPSFSVIVPVYNVSAYLDKCLSSLAVQTLTDLEVILVDDGSTDASIDICNRYAQDCKNFRVYSKPNEGQAIARNYGFERASGKYICYVDSDDWVEPTLCADLREILDRTGADFANYGLDYVTSSGKVVKRFCTFSHGEIKGDQIFDKALIDDEIYSSPCNKAYRRDFLGKHGIRFPPLRANEDLFYSRAVAHAATKTVFVPKVYYHALVRSGSTTRNMSTKNFLITEDLIRFERKQFFGAGEGQRFETRFQAHIIKLLSFLLIQASFRVGQYAEYVACFDIAKRCGFVEYSSNPEAMQTLNTKNRWMARLSRHPVLLRALARTLNNFGIRPY